MRIISGKYGGRRFEKKLPNGIRPTTDSSKETVFNILQNIIELDGINVLDLFAGSGGLGLESLSRGADFCTFTDKSFKAIQYISSLCEVLKIPDSNYECIKIDALKYLKKCSEAGIRFDLIFIDPPYHLGLINDIINSIVDNRILEDGGVVVVESSVESGIQVNQYLQVISNKKFGATQIHLLKKND